MNKEKVYEMLYKAMSECWEWAYDKPENAIAYIDGLWTMADRVAKKLEANVDFVINPRECTEEDLRCFSNLAKEVSI